MFYVKHRKTQHSNAPTQLETELQVGATPASKHRSHNSNVATLRQIKVTQLRTIFYVNFLSSIHNPKQLLVIQRL
jgi:hypothetical protein